MAHLRRCAVCALAQTAVLQRTEQLGVLEPFETIPNQNRDQLYAETRILYCAEGLRLVLALGDAALGRAIYP